jgi:hypothetical protein
MRGGGAAGEFKGIAKPRVALVRNLLAEYGR